MQVHKIQNNTPAFGVKLVVGHGMFPCGNVFDGSDKELLKKLISTVETKTKNKKGIVYISDACSDSYNSNNTYISFKNGKYTDSVILYDKKEQNLRENIDKYIDTLVRLTDVFKMREDAIKTAQKAQKQIQILEHKIYKEMNELCKNIKKTLPERKAFPGSLFEEKKINTVNNVFKESYKRDKILQEKILA